MSKERRNWNLSTNLITQVLIKTVTNVGINKVIYQIDSPTTTGKAPSPREKRSDKTEMADCIDLSGRAELFETVIRCLTDLNFHVLI